MTAANRRIAAVETECLKASIARPTTPGAASETPADRKMQSVPAAILERYGRKNPKKAARSLTGEVYRAAGAVSRSEGAGGASFPRVSPR